MLYLEHLAFQLNNLLPRVGVVGNPNEVTDLWRVHFLVLGGDEHGGDAYQLKLLTLGVDCFQVSLVEREGKGGK